MKTRNGIGVSPGVVIGPAVVLDAEDLPTPRRHVGANQVPAEIERLNNAVAENVVELTQLRDKVAAEHGEDIAGIFDFHLYLLRDKKVHEEFLSEIRVQQTTAEYAVSVVMGNLCARLAAMPKELKLASGVSGVRDVEKRLLGTLIGQKRQDLAHLTTDVVVIAHDLLPSQTAALDRTHVRGLATDVGGRTSHTAIVARALGIPAAVGLGNITGEVSGGDMVTIDGTHGVVS